MQRQVLGKRSLQIFEIKGWQNDECFRMYIINTIPHGNRFVRYLMRTPCFYICYVYRQQLVRKYRTRTLFMRYSVFKYNDIFFIHTLFVCLFVPKKFGLKFSGKTVNNQGKLKLCKIVGKGQIRCIMGDMQMVNKE